MDGWNTNFLLGWPIFRGYVSFRECILHVLFLEKKPQERSYKRCWMDIYRRTGIVFWKISLWMWRAWRLESRIASVWTRSLKASGGRFKGEVGRVARSRTCTTMVLIVFSKDSWGFYPVNTHYIGLIKGFPIGVCWARGTSNYALIGRVRLQCFHLDLGYVVT